MEMHSHAGGLLSEIRNSITVKALVIGGTVLAMIVPSVMIFSLIRERQQRRIEVVEEISSKWGRRQTLSGPVLSIPYKHLEKDKDGKNIESVRYEHFLPETLDVSVSLKPEVRYRGIFEAVVYNAEVEIKGAFKAPLSSETACGRPFISLGISDMRGITDEIDAEFSGRKLVFVPGVESDDIISRGVSGVVDLPPDGAEIPYGMRINLNGSEALDVVPLGRTTTMKMVSGWSSPSFDGAFLPSARNIGEDGFRAEWKIIELNRNFPQSWKGRKYDVHESAFGSRLIIEANIYQQATRTAKYAMLFVVFTFTSVFVSEFITKSRIHPLQYLLIGLAILVFYCLLLALAEHMGFGRAYLVSALSVIVLISLYSKAAFGKASLALAIGSVLTTLYAYFYVILQIEDYSLLMGAAGLFVILSIVMFMTRRINRPQEDVS